MAYDILADDGVIAATIAALKERGIEREVVATKEEAFEKVKGMIPAGASVNNGASVTLQEIGFVEYLKAGEHGWNNLHGKALAESDPAKQKQLRQEAYFADYYLGSVHALAQTGEIVIASNSGSQLSPIITTSPNVIFVVSAQKITSTLADAMDRLMVHVVPLEDARMKSVGMGGTAVNKVLTFAAEPAYTGRKIHVIFVKEKLGY
ncbi:MAG: lactate utilization protein [Candidatus Adlerbacteria bacterium]|nr:lactate utilization protein [Candidatus Adlerbacteria bacterium]